MNRNSCVSGSVAFSIVTSHAEVGIETAPFVVKMIKNNVTSHAEVGIETLRPQPQNLPAACHLSRRGVNGNKTRFMIKNTESVTSHSEV